jgi:uncharacterized membrane protein/plastocyanin
MNEELFDWLLLLGRWLHITVAVTWIGTSIFFMWLDRSFERNELSQRPGHVGEVWMVHGGGFYHVEKLLMGPTKVPERLHWFKWESYWTWMSGMFLVVMIFYTGGGTFLLDSMVSNITYEQGLAIGLFSIFGSWFFYDFVWERKLTRERPVIGHALTLLWFAGMSYFLCKTLSGRAAYLHIGGMLGTWMTANVFMRIIPRQIKMVEASKRGEPVNQDWGKNAKNRSTHNTYFTLPVIFIMLSNHFPTTYGHDWNWLILLGICAAGAAIREYFVTRLQRPKHALQFALIGVALMAGVIVFSRQQGSDATASEVALAHTHEARPAAKAPELKPQERPVAADSGTLAKLGGQVSFEGTAPAPKKLNLPAACARMLPGGEAYSNEVLIKDGKLENVLIRLAAGHEALPKGEVPQTEVEVDQRGCIYVPRVVAVRAGQPVTFINSDPIFHNVRSVTEHNQKFNMAMPRQDQRETKVFQKPELFLQTKCSVHPWMGAYIAVMDHPYYAVTKSDGRFELPPLPPGKYTLEAWHEVFGTQKKEIELSSAGISDLSFTFTR